MNVNTFPYTLANLIHTWPIANPAAGADWVIDVPAGKLWVVRSLKATLATSATVINRLVTITFAGAGALEQYWAVSCAEVQTAALVWNYNIAPFSYLPAATSLLTNSQHYVSMPMVIAIGGGGRISSSTNNIRANDQWNLTAADGVCIEEYALT